MNAHPRDGHTGPGDGLYPEPTPPVASTGSVW